MTDGRVPGEHRGPGAPEATAADAERVRRTVGALERLRAQLLHTQGVLDDYLEQLEPRPDGARTTPGR